MGLWDRSVVPFWEQFVELDEHVVFEFGGVFATGLEDLIHDSNNDMQPFRRFRFLHVVFGGFDGFQRDPFAGSCHVRKHAVFDRIVFRAVRRIVRHSNLQAQTV
jgi:hypothetical protein